jgi:hypothetical protein
MAGKSLKRRRAKGLRIAPLQTYKTVPITDPAEIAKLEAMTKRYDEAERLAQGVLSAVLAKKLTARMLMELAERLSPRGRIQLTTRLASQLPATEQAELVQQLTAQLPPNGRKRR